MEDSSHPDFEEFQKLLQDLELAAEGVYLAFLRVDKQVSTSFGKRGVRFHCFNADIRRCEAFPTLLQAAIVNVSSEGVRMEVGLL